MMQLLCTIIFNEGPQKFKCVLNTYSTLLYYDPNFFIRNTGYFRVCDRHVFMMRENAEGDPPLNSSIQLPLAFSFTNENSLLSISGEKNNKYILDISLPKYTYKKYEPIFVNVAMINLDNEPLELWDNFVPPLYAEKVTITDQNGKQYTFNNSRTAKFEIRREKPSNIIPPSDTLFISMKINDWGKDISSEISNGDNYYFNNVGYFEPGDYTLRIDTYLNDVAPNKHKVKIKSNEIRFKIIDINSVDKTVLSIYKKADFLYNLKPFEEIMRDYPDNAFTEHVSFEYLAGKYLNYYQDKEYEYINNLEKEYEKFIFTYPQSEYLVLDVFVKPYIYKYFMDLNSNKLKNNFNLDLSRLRETNEYNNLEKYLKNEFRIKNILGIK